MHACMYIYAGSSRFRILERTCPRADPVRSPDHSDAEVTRSAACRFQGDRVHHSATVAHTFAATRDFIERLATRLLSAARLATPRDASRRLATPLRRSSFERRAPRTSAPRGGSRGAANPEEMWTKCAVRMCCSLNQATGCECAVA
jgi:hypothetical protein